MAREAWTDERLDDLNRRVDDGFSELRQELRAFRSEVAQQFAAQQRLMIQLFGGMFAMVALGFLGVIATILTQV